MASRRSRRSRRQLPNTPLTINEQFFDAQLRHQISTLRYAGTLRRKVIAILDDTEEDLRRAIRRGMRRSIGFDTPGKVVRLKAVLEEVRKIRKAAWDSVAATWTEDLAELARHEPQFLSSITKTVVPVVLAPRLPDVGRLKAIVTTTPFEGATLNQWARKIANDDIARIQGQINVGLVQGETAPEIARRVVGTVKLKGQNGVVAIAKRDAEAITLTATNHIANQAAREFFKENADIIDRELYVATLDSRTTPVCRANDGKTYPLGEGPIPPLHFRCRSRRVALLDAEAIGKRPSKPVHERRLLREFAEQEGLDRVPKKRADLPRGTKGKFDEYARRRTRELTGRVPAKVSYQEWLKRQPRHFQEDLLGPTRAKLFRRGDLDLDRFVDETGHQKTLAELARDEAAAFRAAGLDPEDFLR